MKTKTVRTVSISKSTNGDLLSDKTFEKAFDVFGKAFESVDEVFKMDDDVWLRIEEDDIVVTLKKGVIEITGEPSSIIFNHTEIYRKPKVK